MTWSEQGTRDVSAALAPYTIKSAKAARNLVRLSVRCVKQATR